MTKHISHVHATNLKGKPFDYDLAPCTIIAGKNFAGKSRIADAIRLVLLGNLPELGSKNAATFELSSGSEMRAVLTLAGCENSTLSRTFSESRGSVKATGDVPAHYAAPLLDSDAWFAMTERQRIDYVFSHVTLPADKTPDGIIASLQQVTFGDQHSEAVEAAKQEVIGAIRETFTRELGPTGDLARLPDAIVRAEAELAEDFTLWNGRAKDSEGAGRIMAELKLREEECSASTLTDLRNEIDRLQGLADEANRALGTLTEQQAAAGRVASRRAEIGRALEEPAPVETPLPTFRASVDLESMRSALQHGLEQLEQHPIEDVAPLEKASHDAAVEKSKAQSAHDQKVGAVADVLNSLAELDALGACPHCQSKGKGWKTNLRATLDKNKEDAMAEVVVSELALTHATTAAEIHFKAWREAVTRQDARAEIEKNIAATRIRITQGENEVAAFERDTTTIRHNNATAASNYENHQKSLRAELARLKDVPLPTETELQAAKLASSSTSQQLTLARERLRTGEQLATRLRDAAAANEIALRAAARRDVIKRIRSTLTDIKGELVSSAFGALLLVANRILGDTLKSPLAYREDTAEVGMWTNTGFVVHKTFSGTERALTYVAIAAALSSTAGLRVLILDELARLTGNLQRRVCDQLAAAVRDGLLDQVIVLLPSDTPIESGEVGAQGGDWHVINLA